MVHQRLCCRKPEVFMNGLSHHLHWTVRVPSIAITSAGELRGNRGGLAATMEKDLGADNGIPATR